MQFVLDCSVVGAWFLENQATAYSEKILQNISQAAAIVPSIFHLECANVLLMAQRRKFIQKSQALNFRGNLKQMNLLVDEDADYDTIYDLADVNQLTSYGASYLELAMRVDLPLATLDKALIKAAKKHNVELLKNFLN